MLKALPEEAEPFADLLSRQESESELEDEGTLEVVESPPIPNGNANPTQDENVEFWYRW